MTSTDSEEPSADEFDELLSDAIHVNRTEENVRDNARLVAAYHTTLIENDVEAEHATEITCLWLAHMLDEDA